MTAQLVALCFDADDPVGLARFWSGVLGWLPADDPRDGVTLLPGDDTGFRIRFAHTSEQKSGPNQMHFDLTSSSLEERVDIGQGDVDWVVMADPDGHEFCLLPPRT